MVLLGTHEDQCVKVNGAHYWATGRTGHFTDGHGTRFSYVEFADEAGAVIAVCTNGSVFRVAHVRTTRGHYCRTWEPVGHPAA